MFVEGPGEVDIEQLLVLDGQPHQTTSKLEVAQVIRVYVRQTVGLECGTCRANIQDALQPHVSGVQNDSVSCSSWWIMLQLHTLWTVSACPYTIKIALWHAQGDLRPSHDRCKPISSSEEAIFHWHLFASMDFDETV